VEVVDDPPQVVGGKGHLVVEVGALEDALELLRVSAADGCEGVVQGLADQRLVGVTDVVPAVASGHLEDMEGRIEGKFLVAEFSERSLRLLFIDVGGALKEEQREDVVLLVGDLVAEQIGTNPFPLTPEG
jgi:hypothetical protein